MTVHLSAYAHPECFAMEGLRFDTLDARVSPHLQ